MAQGVGAAAAEIKVIGLTGMTPLMKELGPQFERTTGHKLVMRFGSGAEGKRLIETGAAMNLLIGVPGAVVIGPFPADLQDYIVFTAGIGVATTEPQAARTLLEYLRSEAARSVMKAQGLEPL